MSTNASEYKRKLDAIMSAAEHSVAPNMHRDRSSASYNYGSGGAALGAMNPNNQGGAGGYYSAGRGGYADPAAGLSHTTSSSGGVGPVHMPPQMQQAWENREEDFGRQLRVCMKEVAELRSELAAEREGRHQLQQLIAKRSKEEVLVEVHSVTNVMRQEMRELEVGVQQRLQESEAGRSVDRRKVDDALRLLKNQERSHFDIAEQYRDQLEEMRQRVDSCVNSSNSVKAEVTHQLENEKGRMEHRLDVELERYSEMHRQHQTALSDTRHVVQREVGEVNKTVKALVETTWDDRVKALQKMLNESLYKYQRTQEQQTDSVSTLSGQVANYLRESKRDLTSNTAELRDRLAILEGNAPILASQMDRVQRKADTAVESNSKIGALVDVLREAADKATAQAVRSSERAQKVEDTMADRDGRILALESQTAALAGFERLRNDLDATKRSVQRVEGQTETVRQIADRCERLVQDMQASVDQAADRGDGIEKKAVRAITKLEASEGKLNNLFELSRRTEEAAEKLRSDAEATNQMREALRGKVDTIEHRLSAHVDSSRQGLQEANEELRQLETRLTASEQQHYKEHVASQTQKMERVERRLQKFESGTGNTNENLNKIKETVDSTKESSERLGKKVEMLQLALQRQTETTEQKAKEGHNQVTSLETTLRSTRSSIGVAEENINRMSNALTGRIDDVDSKVTRLQSTQRQVAAAGAGGGGSAASTAELSSALANIDSLSHTMQDMQRRYDMLDRRMSVELAAAHKSSQSRPAHQGDFQATHYVAAGEITKTSPVKATPQQQQQTTAAPAAAAPVAAVKQSSAVQPLFNNKPMVVVDTPTAPATTAITTPEVFQPGDFKRKEDEVESAGVSGWDDPDDEIETVGNATAATTAATTTAAKTDTTSVVSSVHLQTTAAKPSETNFDDDEEESMVSAAVATAQAPAKTEDTGKPPLGTTTVVGSNKQLPSTLGSGSKPGPGKGSPHKKNPFDDTTTSGSDVGKSNLPAASRSGKQFGTLVESEEISDSAPAKPQPATKRAKSALASAYTSSEGEQTPDRDFKGVGAPGGGVAKIAEVEVPSTAAPQTANPFDKESDSDSSFTLAATQSGFEATQSGFGLPQAASPQSSDSDSRAALKEKMASAGKMNPFFTTAPSADNSPAKAAPRAEETRTAIEEASPPRAASNAQQAYSPLTDASPGVKSAGGGGTTTDDSDSLMLPGRGRAAKHYVSTTGESSDAMTPMPKPSGTGGGGGLGGIHMGGGGGGSAATTEAPAEKTKVYGKAAALAAKAHVDDFDATSSEEEEDAVASRHSKRSGGSSAAGSRKTASSRATDDVSLTFTPSTKTGQGAVGTFTGGKSSTAKTGSKGANTFDDDSDDALDDDALAAFV